MTDDPNVPSLSYIVDALTARIEWAETEGLDDERAALNSALQTLVTYAMCEHRNVSLIRQILARLHVRRYAA